MHVGFSACATWKSAAALLGNEPNREEVVAFAKNYLNALHAAELIFADVVHNNLHKARGAFLDPAPEDLIDFDADFGTEEQLPRSFRIRVNQRKRKKLSPMERCFHWRSID
jgi:hypothetical protein